MTTKEEQKRAALAKYVKSVDAMLTEGMNLLRFWCCTDQVVYCEPVLQRYKTVITEMTADKQTMIDTVAGIENMSYYMMYVFNQAICGVYGYQVDTNFLPEADKNYATYINKVAKSVDAKQTHAPGFD
uniref:Uncharacterized protein n=1 Tax=viral metagenome TaxID=1070528 RepID=A0A6C0JRI3_9ZZZZ